MKHRSKRLLSVYTDDILISNWMPIVEVLK